MKTFLLLFFNLCLATFIWGQPKQSLKVDSVMVVSAYKPNLLDPTKMIFKPGLPDIEKEKPNFKYSKIDRFVNPTYKPEFKAPSQFRNIIPTPTYKNSVSAGFGSTLNPYFHYSGGFQTKNNSFYAQAYHQSAFGSLKSSSLVYRPAFAESNISLKDEFSQKGIKGSIGANYDHIWNKKYGLNQDSIPGPDSLKNQFHRIDIHAVFQSASSSKLEWLVGLFYQKFIDIHQNNEGNLAIKGQIQPQLISGYNTSLSFSFKTTGYNYQLIDPLPVYNYHRSVTTIQPSISRTMDQAWFDANIGFVTENYASIDSTKVHLFPNVSVGYQVSDQLKVSTGLKSGLQWNTYSSLVEQNPFLFAPNLMLNTTERWQYFIRADGGFSGWNFDVKGAIGKYTGMAFFTNNAYDRSFVPVFDSLSTRTWIEGNVHRKVVNQYELMLGILAQKVTTTTLSSAFYTPAFKFQMQFDYCINTKLKAGLQANIWSIRTFEGGLKSPSYLPWVPDISLTAQYQWKSNLSFFGRVQNMAFYNYAYFYGYPNYGPNVLLGLRWMH